MTHGANGMTQFATAMRQPASCIIPVANGVRQLATGMRQLATGMTQLATSQRKTARVVLQAEGGATPLPADVLPRLSRTVAVALAMARASTALLAVPPGAAQAPAAPVAFAASTFTQRAGIRPLPGLVCLISLSLANSLKARSNEERSGW